MLASPSPNKEIEVRLDRQLAEIMFRKMSTTMSTDTSKRELTEIGCTWWTGQQLNANARVRKSSNGESVVKVPAVRARVVPGYTLAYSNEYNFDGIIKNPTYSAKMVEVRRTVAMRGDVGSADTKINMIAKKYTSDIRNYIVGTVGSMAKEIDLGFMSDVGSADHIVVDVPNMDGYKGRFMATSKVPIWFTDDSDKAGLQAKCPASKVPGQACEKAVNSVKDQDE
ncbi:hypothetical protein F4779DRAFT_637296 [Xylariaceae sp. FL0662B]|nr:hypothetical protein F4779DRAFT_637296 [Xylariaceae sp. FL0662B]